MINLFGFFVSEVLNHTFIVPVTQVCVNGKFLKLETKTRKVARAYRCDLVTDCFAEVVASAHIH